MSARVALLALAVPFAADGGSGSAELPHREGAVIVATAAELSALVTDPAGPAEIELRPGVYGGDLTIRRPVAIRGAGHVVLEGSGRGTVVTVDASDVVLEHLTVRGSGHHHTAEDAGIKATGARVVVRDAQIEDTLFGASLQACVACTLESVVVIGPAGDDELRGDGIKLWESHDSIVRNCRVEHSRDVVVWYTKRAVLEDNVVTHGRYGSHFMYAHDSVVRRSRFEHDVVGIFVMYSMRLRVEDNILAGARGAAGVGLGFKDSDGVEVRRNWIVANTSGTYLDNTPRTPDAPVVFEGNLFALNDLGIRLHSSEKGVSLRQNDFHENATFLAVDGGGDALGLDARGNHFSDYEGYDLDRDGTGDVAFEVKALSSELVESHPTLKLFGGTAAMGLVDTVARAVPLLSSQKLFVDPAPLAHRPSLPRPRTP